MKTNDKTAVIYRTFNSGGEVIALFPFEPSDIYGHHCMSYQRVGQHSGATPDLMIGHYTRQATPIEIEPLRNELTRIGYDLKEMKRFPRNAFEVRKSKAAL